MNMFENNGAEFSKCGKYRYSLWRIWDDGGPFLGVIGLNPSTANASTDDPTIRRVKKFAYDWGYGGVYMMNLFAYVTAYPEVLKQCEDPIGDNDKWLKETSAKCDKIIFAWGAFPEAAERSQEVIKMFPEACALHINKDGTPKHPLYVKGDAVPIPFKKQTMNHENKNRN